MGVPKRSDIAVGSRVGIETKADQGTVNLTEETVEAILTGGEYSYGTKIWLHD